MYCQKCGNENRDGASFCVKCGAPLMASVTPEVPVTAETPETQPAEAISMEAVAPEAAAPQREEQSQPLPQQPEAPKEKKPVPKKLLIIIGAVAAALALSIGLCVLLFGRPTINLNNYLVTEAEGYNGHGDVYVYVDWTAIEEDYGDRVEYTKEFQKENFVYDGYYEDYRAIDFLSYNVYVEVEKDYGVSNDEEVAYTWYVDEGLEDIIDCKLRYSDGTFTVSGLTEMETFDAFADVEISFEGVAPNGTANITYKGDELDIYDFYLDYSTGLSDGDVVTVYIDGYVEDFADELGKIPATMQKEYTVEGLGGFLTKMEDLSDTDLKTLKDEAVSIFKDELKYWNEDTETLSSITYKGNYLLTLKDRDDWGYDNILYLVYKVDVRNKFTNDDGQTYDKVNSFYWYVEFPDIVITKDGKMSVDLDDYDTPWDNVVFESDSEDDWDTMSWYYEGYETLDELYEDVVESETEDYNHEDNIKE